jgi:NADPH:quinone reductase-like Zn-dependent oxidoreductase
VIVGGDDGNRVTSGIGRQLRAMALSSFVAQRLTTFISTGHHSFIDRLADYLEAGTVKAVIASHYPVDNGFDGVRRMERDDTSGKTVIVVRWNGASGIE